MKRLFMVLAAGAGLMLSSTAVFAQGHPGAVFTTAWDGAQVNANHFEYGSDVYLDGGPGPNAPAHAAALPAGDYVFQVTDPSGKALLSTDPPECRTFHVDEAGLISGVGDAGGCEHATGYDPGRGAVTVQLYHFEDSPNAGGVYKVWVTPVDEFDPAGGGYYGFAPSESKTDNFKVVYSGGIPD